MKSINFTLVGCLLLSFASATPLSQETTSEGLSTSKAKATEQLDDDFELPALGRGHLDPIPENPEEEDSAQREELETPGSPPDDSGKQLRLSYGPVSLGPLSIGIEDSIKQDALPKFHFDAHTRFIVFGGGLFQEYQRPIIPPDHRQDNRNSTFPPPDRRRDNRNSTFLDRRQPQHMRILFDIRMLPYKIDSLTRCVYKYDTLRRGSNDFNGHKCALLKSSAISAAIKSTLDYSIGSLKSLGNAPYSGFRKQLTRRLTKSLEKLDYGFL